ncbi:cytidylyltransferase domain-containing protein [Christiangramia sediminis]|uniref:Acylneuraminate cytidylyltransferase family protein n=1 Tax=Christiangramia sediminis TaxID=2881336 RepID=A0A9X1RY11_9FLAO|nr:acylneuraminate cytidylyltransferase family protein [Christiangramia sediminis]MCB7481339.1 acylneuraminate cytidylyltransferase family protein [Christiangramia sediminis]
MKILGIIPARGGSKGIPGKNIKLLGKKPLLEYTVDAVRSSSLLDRCILSSEDNNIIQIAHQLGLDVPFKRPENLADDNSTSLDVIRHAIDFFESKNDFFDAVCLLQVTSPFREKSLIDKAILKFIESRADSLISVREVPSEYNPHWVFEEAETNLLKIATGESEIISQRQKLPKAYHRDGSIYLSKTSVIKNQNSLYGEKISFIDNTGSSYVNIDEPADWKKAENLLKSIR